MPVKLTNTQHTKSPNYDYSKVLWIKHAADLLVDLAPEDLRSQFPYFTEKQPLDEEGVNINGYEETFQEDFFKKYDKSPNEVQALLRVIKTFGSLDDLASALTEKPGLVSLKCPKQLVAPVASLLGKMHSKKQFLYTTSKIHIETVSTKKTVGADYSPPEDFQHALETGQPIVVLYPDCIALPKAYRDLDMKDVTLARMDDEILFFHMGFQYSDDPFEISEIHAQCSDIDKIDSLTPRLPRAFREENRAAALKYLFAPTKTSAQRNNFKTFKKFPLADNVKQPILHMLRCLRDHHDGKLPWKNVPRGILLDGPPGCGKTEIARMIEADGDVSVICASVANCNFAGSGGSAAVLHQLAQYFAQAIKCAPCVLFIDEIDSVGNRSQKRDHNSTYVDIIVAGFLELMDGFAQREGVVILGATNHIQNVDPALKRPGRLDKIIRMEHPGPELMADVLRWHLEDDLVDADLNVLVPDLIGASGAEIAGIVRQAQSTARADGNVLTMDHLSAAVREGRDLVPDEVLTRIAVHEAGHAIVGYVLSGEVPDLVAIYSSGGGVTQTKTNFSPVGAQDFTSKIAEFMAGRAAETLIFGTVSAGAGGDAESDLAQATMLAASLEASYGLGQSRIWRGTPMDVLMQATHDQNLRSAVEKRLISGEGLATKVLIKRVNLLNKIASLLFEKRMLTRNELSNIFEHGSVSGIAGEKKCGPAPGTTLKS